VTSSVYSAAIRGVRQPVPVDGSGTTLHPCAPMAPTAPARLAAVAPLVQLNAPPVWSHNAPATAVPSAAHWA